VKPQPLLTESAGDIREESNVRRNSERWTPYAVTGLEADSDLLSLLSHHIGAHAIFMGQKSSSSKLPTIMHTAGNGINASLLNGQQPVPRVQNRRESGVIRTKILLLGLRR
jgi:hypothetical protein